MGCITGIKKNSAGVFLPCLLAIGLFVCLVACVQANDRIISETYLKELNEENWSDMLKGEWMVEFFAPWCPACKSLAPTWEHFADIVSEFRVNVAKIDVTTSPSLSGRFFVTALPTIYHVKNGEFRQYRGSRDANALVQFIKLRQWEKIEKISSWKNPDTIHMSILSYFFKLSHTLKDFNGRLQEEYGLPSWGSYALFAIGTVFVGATLGLILVCLVDFLYPPKRSPRLSFAESKAQSMKEGVEDLAEDDLEDDAEDEDAGDGDANADNDDENDNEKDSDEEAANQEAAGDNDDEDEEEDDDDETSPGELNSNSEAESEKSEEKATAEKSGKKANEHETDNDNEKNENVDNAKKQIAEEKEQQKSSEVRKRKPRKAD